MLAVSVIVAPRHDSLCYAKSGASACSLCRVACLGADFSQEFQIERSACRSWLCACRVWGCIDVKSLWMCCFCAVNAAFQFFVQSQIVGVLLGSIQPGKTNSSRLCPLEMSTTQTHSACRRSRPVITSFVRWKCNGLARRSYAVSMRHVFVDARSMQARKQASNAVI